MTGPTNESRPPIGNISNSNELKRWYWLKDELIAQAKICGVKNSGAKFVILDRLAHFLDTGKTTLPSDRPKPKNSKFDWHKEPLSIETKITDSYKNTQNVRRFFLRHAGAKFKFNIAFMKWMKSNIGKSLGESVEVYHQMQKRAAEPGNQTRIEPHNQFNQYTRDFLADNPQLGMDDVRRVWALKKSLPTQNGRHVYAASDLNL